jgi:hypothetical protein
VVADGGDGLGMPGDSPPTTSRWNPSYPLNARTVVYCLLAGVLFSWPLSFVADEHVLFEPPQGLQEVYPYAVLASFVLLPIWCEFAVKRYRFLWLLGPLCLLALLYALLMPTMK